MSRELDDEILLFNYSVFGTTNWSDTARKSLIFNEGLRFDLVNSVSNLYERIDVIGHKTEV